MQVVTDQNFQEEVMRSEKPVLVDFFAIWCGPCKMLMPILEELAGEYDGKVKIVKIDVDESPDTSGQFGIQSIPTLIFIKDGREVERLSGFRSREELKTKLDALG